MCGADVRHGRHARAGATVNGPQSPAVWVYPSAVAASLGLDATRQGLWNAMEELWFRKALGVVLTHELLHKLAGAPHTEGGIMAPRLTRGALLRSPQVPADLWPALHQGVRDLGRELSVEPAGQALVAEAADERELGP
jgi:hypothetical protein